MSHPFRVTLLWLTATAVAAVFALSWLPAAFDGDAWYPVGADSFYHARRILDAAADPSAFYQFDPAIHAPDGSLLTWPWAYNLLAAHALRLAGSLDLGLAPLQFLAYLPVAAVVIGTALVTLIGRALALPLWALACLLACYATSPLTRELYAVGRLDHHYLEHLFFLAFVYTGLLWFRSGKRRHAAALGLVLGMAPAFHNGLFVLQAFLALACLVAWLRRRFAPGKSAPVFAAALIAGTAVALLPSEPFARFEWGFYYLGWFHLASAVLTAGGVLALARLEPGPRAYAMLAGTGALLAAFAWSQIEHGGRFVSAELPALRDVTEARSLLDAVRAGEFRSLTERYSAFVWALPLIWIGLALTLLTTRSPGAVFVSTSLLAGSLLATQQLRLQYFGSLALYLAPLVAAAAVYERVNRRQRSFAVVIALVVFAAVLPSLRTFGSHPPLGADRNYALNRPLLVRLGEICAAAPGAVLARFGDGHYLRFHTDCDVIANNMIMTPQHLERIAFTESLFALSAEELRAAHPWIRYVYLWRQDNPMSALPPEAVRAANPRLAHDLLLAETAPTGYERLGEIALTRQDTSRLAVARIWRIVPP